MIPALIERNRNLHYATNCSPVDMFSIRPNCCSHAVSINARPGKCAIRDFIGHASERVAPFVPTCSWSFTRQQGTAPEFPVGRLSGLKESTQAQAIRTGCIL